MNDIVTSFLECTPDEKRSWKKYGRAARCCAMNSVKARRRHKMERRAKYWINQAVKWRLKWKTSFVKRNPEEE